MSVVSPEPSAVDLIGEGITPREGIVAAYINIPPSKERTTDRERRGKENVGAVGLLVQHIPLTDTEAAYLGLLPKDSGEPYRVTMLILDPDLSSREFVVGQPEKVDNTDAWLIKTPANEEVFLALAVSVLGQGEELWIKNSPSALKATPQLKRFRAIVAQYPEQEIFIISAHGGGIPKSIGRQDSMTGDQIDHVLRNITQFVEKGISVVIDTSCSIEGYVPDIPEEFPPVFGLLDLYTPLRKEGPSYIWMDGKYTVYDNEGHTMTREEWEGRNNK